MGEHDVTHAAFKAFEGTTGKVLVEEVMERQHKRQDRPVVVARAVGEREVKTETAANHILVSHGEVSASSDSDIVVDTSFEAVVPTEEDTGTRLGIESAEVVQVFETYLLTLEVSTGIDAEEAGSPRGIKTDAEVADFGERIAESAVIGAKDIKARAKALFLYTYRKNEVSGRNDTRDNSSVIFIVKDEVLDGTSDDIIYDGCPIVGRPGTGIEREFTILRDSAEGEQSSQDKG